MELSWSWGALEDDLSGPTRAPALGHEVVPGRLEASVVIGAVVALAEELPVSPHLAGLGIGLRIESMLLRQKSGFFHTRSHA